MDHILVLVDFSSTADLAVEQAISIARWKNAKIIFCHIDKSYYGNVPEDLQAKMKVYVDIAKVADIPSEGVFEKGDLFFEAEKIITKREPDLVLVGTHGKKGIKQNLFGSNIYKLVKHVPAPIIVVNDLSTLTFRGYSKLLLPVAPHPDFLTKVKTSASLISEGGTMFLFAIRRSEDHLSNEILENIAASKEYLDSIGQKWEYIEFHDDHFSIGYAGATIKFARDNHMDLVAIKTKVSDTNRYFGDMDKENLLINDAGLQVLCSP